MNGEGIQDRYGAGLARDGIDFGLLPQELEIEFAYFLRVRGRGSHAAVPVLVLHRMQRPSSAERRGLPRAHHCVRHVP